MFSFLFPSGKQASSLEGGNGKKGDRLPGRKDPGKLFLVLDSYVHDPQTGLLVMVIQGVSNISRYDFKERHIIMELL